MLERLRHLLIEAAKRDWWYEATPQQRRAYIAKHPNSKYAKPPYHVRPEHTHSLVSNLRKQHGRATSTPSKAKDYLHTRHHFTVPHKQVRSALTTAHKHLLGLGFRKTSAPTSNHYVHPTSRHIVNVKIKPSRKPKHSRIQILHIHPK